MVRNIFVGNNKSKVLPAPTFRRRKLLSVKKKSVWWGSWTAVEIFCPSENHYPSANSYSG